jgi:hypothetical protein
VPTAKRLAVKAESNNYYGFKGPLGGSMESYLIKHITIFSTFVNTLYDNNQLSILFGPDFAQSNKTNLPIKMPIDNANLLAILQTSNPVIDTIKEYFNRYIKNISMPFEIISQYVMENTMKDATSGVISDTIVQLIEQLNTALENDKSDQAKITALEGEVAAQSNSLLNVGTSYMPIWSTATTTKATTKPATKATTKATTKVAAKPATTATTYSSWW